MGRCIKTHCRPATDAELLLAHPQEHLDRIRESAWGPPHDGGMSEEWKDAYCSPGTAQAAILSAGTTVDLATRLCTGEASSAIAVVRPPGHHAEMNVSQGVCVVCWVCSFICMQHEIYAYM